MYCSSTPAAFSLDAQEPEAAATPTGGRSVELTLAHLLGRGATGDAWAGSWTSEGRHAPVVAKLAFGNYVGEDEQREDVRRLEKERRVYARLESAGVDGVPQCGGLFRDMDGFRQVAMLILSYEGNQAKMADLTEEDKCVHSPYSIWLQVPNVMSSELTIGRS